MATENQSIVSKPVTMEELLQLFSQLNTNKTTTETTNQPLQVRFRQNDRANLRCTHCGGPRHTKDGCFKIIGYPDWWADRKKKEGDNQHRPSKAAYSASETPETGDKEGGAMMVTASPEKPGLETSSVNKEGMTKNIFHFPFYNETVNNIETKTIPTNIETKPIYKTKPISNRSTPNVTPSCKNQSVGLIGNSNKNKKWIFDCGATDTMTFDNSDFEKLNKPTKTHIQTANGKQIETKGSGEVDITDSIKLPNCLFIPQLSHKLLSISQLTKELKCTVLMDSTGCIVQDAWIGKIIGHGTEENGLYYVDRMSQNGCAALVHGSVEHQLWTWHRRLGHPSVGMVCLIHGTFSTKGLVVADKEKVYEAKVGINSEE